MKAEIDICEICKKEARSVEVKCRDNWVELDGVSKIRIWLESPRVKNEGFMHTVGWQGRDYHFCSIECLIKALKQKESI